MYNTNTCILKPKKKNQKKTKLYIPFYDKNKLNIVFRSKIKNKLNLVEQKGIYRSTRKDYKWGIRTSGGARNFGLGGPNYGIHKSI